MLFRTGSNVVPRKNKMKTNLAVGSLAPHALDEVFIDGPKAARQKFAECDVVVAALDAAEIAYLDAKQNQENNPGICGGSSDHAARVALLEKLNNG